MAGLIDPFAHGTAQVGDVMVYATENRGHSAEELAEMALLKILHIKGDVPAPIKAQVEAYKDNLQGILIFYMRQAMLSARTTMRAEIVAEIKDKG
tara:strand:- start:1961 stop:2245 length:285 start_codon:yes stop_codon:yes gene_type:complete